MAKTSIDYGLDTSVVLRLLVGKPLEMSLTAFETVARVRRDGGVVFVSDLVVAEAYFALHTAYQVPKKEALSTLADLLSDGYVEPEPGGCAAEVLNECLTATSKPGFVDRLIHARYRRQGLTMLTFEKAARKLADSVVLH